MKIAGCGYESVVTRSADRVLDVGTCGNIDVVIELADRREAARSEIDVLIVRISGAIKGVVAPAVINGHPRRAVDVVGKIVHRSCRRVEPVDRAARSRLGRGAIEFSDRIDRKSVV